MENPYWFRLLLVVLYAAGVGIAMRVFTILWRNFFNIEVTAREGGAVAGAIVGLLVIWGIGKGPHVAIPLAAILVAAYFVGKLIMKQMG
jgi:hypothetical protein